MEQTAMPSALRIPISQSVQFRRLLDGPCGDIASQVLLLDGKMKELARHLVNEGSLLLFGRGYNYATALEAALKARRCRRCLPLPAATLSVLCIPTCVCARAWSGLRDTDL